MKKSIVLAGIVGACLIVAAAIIARAYTFKYRSADTVVVTGLGEKEFTSDLIVWRGWLTQQSATAASGYEQLAINKRKVQEFISSKGIPDSCVVFMFVNVNRINEPIYSGGQYVGQRPAGYELRQEFTVQSTDVTRVENTSREISSLIVQGVQMESWQPEYYYTKLSDVKLELIKRATEDGRMRAQKIVDEAGSKLGKLGSGKMGVFQITGANANEEFSAGGNFNTSNKDKKARITVRLEYHVK